jgi:hypothetical protein
VTVTAAERATRRNGCSQGGEDYTFVAFGEHWHCEECEACLPPYESYDCLREPYSPRGPRSDKRYCSNACRQRAYRRRKVAS